MSTFEAVLEANKRLDIQLSEYLSHEFSRSTIQKYIKNKKVSINNQIITKISYTSPEPKKIIFTKPQPKAMVLIPNNQKIPILYQDEYLAIVHKPNNLTVHPGAGTKEDTLVHSLVAQVDSLSNENSERPGIIHRLDRETEGIMVIAKTTKAHEKMSILFQNRLIYKEYHAWIHQNTNFQQTQVDGYITRDPIHRKKMKFTKQALHHKSKFASLVCQTIKNLHNFSLIKIILNTGRTHQIRASMLASNSPVVGDKLYFFKKKFMPVFEHGLLLVANRIKFQHPFTLQNIDFEIPLPTRFLKFEEEDYA